MTVDGNWTNNDATSAFSGGTSTVDSGGTATLGGTSATTFNDVTIAPGSGNTVTLGIGETIAGTFTISSGTFNANAYATSVTGL